MEVQLGRREEKKIKGAIAAASGSGKTFSALLLAYGIVKTMNPGLSDEKVWKRICVIDTENKSSSLYIDVHKRGHQIGQFKQIHFIAPYSPERYIEAVSDAYKADIDVCVIDSMSHAWNGKGGVLQIADDNGGFTGGGWKIAGPREQKLWDAIITIPVHVIATMRTEADYAIYKDEKTGKNKVEKLGTKPTQRKDFEYEFDFVLNLNKENEFSTSKDRTGIFEDAENERLSPEYGEKLLRWSTKKDVVKDKVS